MMCGDSEQAPGAKYSFMSNSWEDGSETDRMRRICRVH
jgi:hypothetical protein